MVKPGGTGSPRAAISRQIRAFAAEEIFHLPPPFGLFGAEGINPFRHVELHELPGPVGRSAYAREAYAECYPTRAVEQKVHAQKRAQHVEAVDAASV